MRKTETGTGKDKRLVLHYVWEILRKHSNESHPLQRKEILNLLREQYEAGCSLRSLHDYIRILQEAGYPIVTKKIGCYYAVPQEFTDAELRLLIDDLLFSRKISRAQAEKTINKLMSEGSQGFKQNKDRFRCYWQDMTYSDNEQTLKNVGVIQKAIAREKKIRFLYNTYDAELNFRPKRDEPYILSPYYMIVSQGRYYLVGNVESHEDAAHFRIDRMTEVELLDAPAKQRRQIQELKTISLPDYSAQHFYMFSGKIVSVQLRTEEWMVASLVDWFGKSLDIQKQPDGGIKVRLRCNESAIKYWALQYGNSVEILSPDSLRKSIAEIVRGMYEKYCGGKEEQERNQTGKGTGGLP